LLAERRLDVDFGRGALNREGFVVAAFGHHSLP
jgi:hypothetical protein